MCERIVWRRRVAPSLVFVVVGVSVTRSRPNGSALSSWVSWTCTGSPLRLWSRSSGVGQCGSSLSMVARACLTRSRYSYRAFTTSFPCTRGAFLAVAWSGLVCAVDSLSCTRARLGRMFSGHGRCGTGLAGSLVSGRWGRSCGQRRWRVRRIGRTHRVGV